MNDRITTGERSRRTEIVRVVSADSPIPVSRIRYRWGAIALDLAPVAIVVGSVLAALWWILL